MPDASRWPLVKELFQAALDRPPAERAAFLDQACPDADLRAEVQSLLASHDQAGAFMEAPVTAPGARAEATLAPGTRLGPYAITAAVGSGGMGEVYRARDERLGREVAVKVLPRDLAADPGRRRRFEQEARAASALNHPNIVAVYDARCDDEVPFMVTELLHGQALDAWLQQGPLPVRKALDCALQAARGLSAAHERGIVHRDLKPANLFLTSEGQLKILDFGIAKLSPALEGAATGRREPATTSGVVLGTVGYMSPEQVRGARVDFRSDQFSLGCVLYELLAGEPPFLRPSAAQTMAAVLQDEPPPLAEVNPRVPLPVAWVAERCLAKDPDERYGSTRDLARDLELAQARLTELTRPVAASRARPRAHLLAAAAGGLALLAAAAALGRWARPAPATVPSLRYLTYSGRDTSPAASPDGKTIAFSSTRGGPRRIWIKQLATGSEVPLTAGDDDDPRFSPDGAHILFSRREGGRVSLYRVPAVGGEPRKLVDDALYGDYSPDGSRLAFVRQLAEHGGITSVIAVAGADGAGARELARLDGSRYAAGAFVHPRWSP
ncbi:MAG TPA: protein kinase, partial [Vicinamibacteria bacterium]|nr:protein kinase [Vicinamibacteria bacterium]